MSCKDLNCAHNFSACCAREMKVISSDEGTSFYQCEFCNKPCDAGNCLILPCKHQWLERHYGKDNEVYCTFCLERTQFEDEGKPIEKTNTFTVTVDYDDPAYREMPKRGDYVYYVDSELTIAHFPVRGEGKKAVKFKYLNFDHDWTTQEALDEITKRGYRRPDFAETLAFLKASPNEQNENPIISFCGGFGGHGVGRCMADVCASGGGLHFRFDDLRTQWYQRIRVLVCTF